PRCIRRESRLSRRSWPRRVSRWSERRIAQVRGWAPGRDDTLARGVGESSTPLVHLPGELENARGARGEHVRRLLRGGVQVVVARPARGQWRERVLALARIRGGV